MGIGEGFAYELSKYNTNLVLCARTEDKLLTVAENCKISTFHSQVSKEVQEMLWLLFVMSQMRKIVKRQLKKQLNISIPLTF
jgi:NADP-dependent 3-hydroxy acid dehydrogenase YdfG